MEQAAVEGIGLQEVSFFKNRVEHSQFCCKLARLTENGF